MSNRVTVMPLGSCWSSTTRHCPRYTGTSPGAAVTVQLTVSGEATPAADPPTEAQPPMTDAAFGAVFDDAVRAATS